MAATLVGGAFLTSTLDVLFDRLASKEFINFFRGRKHDASLLKKLKLKLVGLNKVLNDAEDKQITDRAVKEWLDELKGAVYDAEDLVDEIATQALRCKVEAEYQSGSNQRRPPLLAPPWLYPCTKLFDDKIESKLEKMIDTLEDFSKEIDVLGLREVAGRNWSQIRLPTTSLVDESCVYGRENDKEEIMKLLLSDGESSDKVDVIPIVGMGGVGKTTLAQRLYNDDKLYGHFVKKAWVCVSDKFDVERVTRTIVEEVNGQASDARSLNSLQVKLKESLSGKKFLIVLDDVWNENYDNWIALMTPFKFGAQGSKIIVTTRNESVATIMQTVPIHGLKKLPEEDCWKLFSKHAFEKGDGNAYPNLERIGKEIVRKCNGFPLAVKMLGGILRSQRDVKDWNNILESAIWELSEEKSNILPALRLSYHYLPSHLKRCFAYCSIFMKEYEFNMEELVSIWMAEGLLVKPKNYKTVEEEGYELVSIWMAEGLLVKPKNYKTVEEEGYECFRELLSRSFFQRSNANDSLYVMHDLVHDLAQYVMGDFCYRLEDGNPHGIAEKVRYLSIVSSRPVTSKKFMEIKEAKCLRTFLPLKHKDYCGGTSHLNAKDMDEILPRLTHLRLLSLRNLMIKELPHSIGDMIYLRFLDLSYNLIRELPKSVYTLYNLETLLLVDCGLETLSADLVKLISLRHLDLRGSNLKEMPMNISRLKDLQRLTIFIVGKCSGSGINELGEFHCLRGTISISGLQNVKSGHDAMEAKMSEKKQLERLALEWDSTSEDSLNAREVLEKLEPHTNLKHLEIKNYGGTRFPTWLEDQSFCNMVSLRLEDCENCFILPSLGQMPSLKELSIARMPGITNVGCEFYGETSSLSNPFPSLETLCFKEMSGWVGWCILDAEEFSRLKKLEVIMCPKLIGHLPTKVPSLVELNILCCPKLVASLPSTTSIRKLQLLNCQGMQLQWQGVSSVEILQILGSASLEEFPSELVTLTNLKDLVVHDCPRLYVPQSTEMSHCTMFLDLLILSECESLKSIPLGLFPKLRELGIWNCTNFETLILEGCKNTLSFPGGGLPAPNLSMLFIQGSKKLKSLPEQMHTLLPSLDKLELDGCPEIESFPEGGLPSALTDLSISNCEKLKSFPEGGLPSKLVNLTIHNCKKLFGGRRDWGLQTLPSLKWLSVGGESEDVLESFPEEGLLPSTLTFLCIRDLLNLKSLNGRGLQLLGSLDCMKIVNCPQLQSLPEEGLPTSLFTLKFEDCPLLKPRCRRDWPVIAHIGAIFIDNQPFMDGWMD